ncbi:hypothetical protein [Mesorhizobium sp.]|uniref:hypothetical protein n=1 Tax=Mesorhizobium sp. TaxID=1871066 RepID=UPI0026C2DAC6
MSEVTTIGLDIAKDVFHAHGADERGRGVFSKRLTRAKVLDFLAAQPPCIVALEAYGGAHHWACELTAQGHEVRPIPPASSRSSNGTRTTRWMRRPSARQRSARPCALWPVKSEEQQASALVFRTRDLVVRQRTQLLNAIRGHITEYGWVAPKGPSYVSLLGDLLEEEMASPLPPAAVAMFRVMLDLLADLDERIADLDREIDRRAREDETARRLMTIPASIRSARRR